VEGKLVDLDQDLRPGIEPSLSGTPVVVVCHCRQSSRTSPSGRP
jgi:hypothetical protein